MKKRATKKKSPFMEALENFWYYYKWIVLVGIVVFFAVLLVSVWKSDGEKTGDITVLSVYARPLTQQEYSFDAPLSDLVSDHDTNGKSEILTKSYYVSENGKSDNDSLAMSKIENDLAYANGDLILLDGTNRDRYIGKDFLENLEDYMDLSAIPEEDIVRRNGTAVMVRLQDSAVLRNMGFFTDDVYAGIMFIPAGDSTAKVRREDAARAILRLIEK